MTIILHWWEIPLLITLLSFTVANWWPDDSLGVSAAAGGFIRLFIWIVAMAAMWIGLLVWRLNT